MSKRIIIAGGGTGGHIFPAIAIANALKKIDPATEVLFVGAKGKMEMEKVPQAGYQIRGIDIAGFNRSSLIKNIGLPFKLIRSFTQVSRIVKEFRPDAVAGVGGYSSFPVLRYAQSKGIPTFIHESNSFAGRTNMLLGKKANRIFVSGDGMEKFFPAPKIMVTGNPVRASIVNSVISRSEALSFFGLDASRKTIFITGGSLGARMINETIEDSVEELTGAGLQLIWQTGKLFADKARKVSEGKTNIWTGDFISKMELAFAAADVVISRSGAIAIAELSVVAKPVIFVPYPFAAEDHQTVNAQRLVARQAAVMIKDGEAKQKLIPAIISLAENEQLQKQLIENIGRLAVINADEIVAAEILKEIHG